MSEPVFHFPYGTKKLSELTLDEAKEMLETIMDSYERQRQNHQDYINVDKLLRK